MRRRQHDALDVRNGFLCLLEDSLAHARLVDQEAVNRLQALAERFQIIDHAHILGALGKHIQVDETERVLVFPEHGDGAEVLLLRKIHTRIEIAERVLESWQPILVHDPEAMPLVDHVDLEHAILALTDECLRKPA